MKNSKFMIQLLAMLPVIFIPTMVLVVATLIVDAEEAAFDKDIAQIENDFIETEKSRIRSKINNMVDLVEHRHSIIKQQLHDRIQRRVEDAHKVSRALYDHYKNELPEQQLKELIIESLRPLEWHNGESYIWIVNYDGVLQLGADYMRGLESKSIIDFEDLSGRKVIQEEILLAKDKGQGFLWDTFTKPGEPENKQFQQLAFVKGLGFYDWYIGSAEFLDTATKTTETQLLEAINQIGKGATDYAFVVDTNGNLLLNYARPDIVGRNMSETDDSNLHDLFKMIIKTGLSNSDKFISYNWLNPKTGTVDSKLTYVRAVPNSDWVIGSGFYPNMLERGYEAQQLRVKTQHQQKVQYFTTLTWLSLMGALLIAAIMSAMFYKTLTKYREGLAENNDELKQSNLDLEQEIIETNRKLTTANEEIRNLAIADETTLFANHKYSLKRLEYEMDRSQRYKSELSLILFEIQDWKSILEGLGKSNTNQLLVEFSSELRHQLRSVDILGRLSVDDFMILMPGINVENANHIIQRINRVLEDKSFMLDRPVKIVISAVATEYQPGENITDFLSRAEDLMLAGKDLADD